MEIDCADESDEQECEIPVLPEGYSKEIPHLENDTVNFKAILSSVMSVNIQKFKVEINGEFKFWWMDKRVIFKNLRKKILFNSIKQPEVLWMPFFIVFDASNAPADLKQTNSQLYAIKQTKSLLDDESSIYEGKLIN